MSYGHGEQLKGELTPLHELRDCINQLNRWSRLNPGLEPLYKRFYDCIGSIERDYAKRDNGGLPADEGQVS
jgi:hypothetical protein